MDSEEEKKWQVSAIIERLERDVAAELAERRANAAHQDPDNAEMSRGTEVPRNAETTSRPQPAASTLMTPHLSVMSIESGEIIEGANGPFNPGQEELDMTNRQSPRVQMLMTLATNLNDAQERFQIPVYDGGVTSNCAAPVTIPDFAGSERRAPTAPRAANPPANPPPTADTAPLPTTLFSKACQLKGFNPVWEKQNKYGQQRLCLVLPDGNVFEARTSDNEEGQRQAKLKLAQKGLKKLVDEFGSELIEAAKGRLSRERAAAEKTNLPQSGRRQWPSQIQKINGMKTSAKHIVSTGRRPFTMNRNNNPKTSMGPMNGGGAANRGPLRMTDKGLHILKLLEDYTGDRELGARLQNMDPRDAYLLGLGQQHGLRTPHLIDQQQWGDHMAGNSNPTLQNHPTSNNHPNNHPALQNYPVLNNHPALQNYPASNSHPTSVATHNPHNGPSNAPSGQQNLTFGYQGSQARGRSRSPHDERGSYRNRSQLRGDLFTGPAFKHGRTDHYPSLVNGKRRPSNSSRRSRSNSIRRSSHRGRSNSHSSQRIKLESPHSQTGPTPGLRSDNMTADGVSFNLQTSNPGPSNSHAGSGRGRSARRPAMPEGHWDHGGYYDQHPENGSTGA